MIPATMGSPPENENARRQPSVGQNKTTTPVFCYPSPSSVKGRVIAALAEILNVPKTALLLSDLGQDFIAESVAARRAS